MAFISIPTTTSFIAVSAPRAQSIYTLSSTVSCSQLLKPVLPATSFHRTTMHMHMHMHTEIKTNAPISRRQAITTTVAVILGGLVPSLLPSSIHAFADETETQIPSITFSDFVQKLEAKQVSKVTFKGAQYDTAYATINDQVFLIKEGYPKESSTTSESPLVLQAKLRDMKVKYEVDFGIPARKKKAEPEKEKEKEKKPE